MDLMKITDPKFLTTMEEAELKILASDIRKLIVDTVSTNSGHLGGNLGIVDLTIALEKEFQGWNFIYDVGHQAYTHKILTGRAKDFINLRKHNGLSGFPLRSESKYDKWDVAHASTSLASLAGYLEKDENSIAIIGDGALTGGEALEGLEYIGALRKRAIVILNDNNFSISQNVGLIHNLLLELKKKGINDVNPFSALGFKYYGPLLSNDYKSLEKCFKLAKDDNCPVIIHVLTEKGTGYKPAFEDKKGTWHCVNPFNKETGEIYKNKDMMSFGEATSSYLIEFNKLYDDLRVVMPAMTNSSNMDPLKDTLNSKFIDTGITEQFATSLSASLAINGFKTVLTIYSSFLQRAYDQLHQDISMQNAHVVVMLDKCQLVPGNGKTHQGIYDIAYLSTIPNLKVIAPKDINELFMMMEYALLNYDGPIAIHTPSESSKRVNDIKVIGNDIDLSWNKINNIDNPKAYLITYSTLVDYIKDSMMELGVEVINARSIKPMDLEMLDYLKSTNKKIFVYEEAPSERSLASMISYYYNGYKIYPIGLPLDYIDIGTIEELRKDNDIDRESVVKKVKSLL